MNERPSQAKAIWALVLALFGPCCCYLPAVLGIILGNQAIKQSEESVVDRGRGLGIAAIGAAAAQFGMGFAGLVVLFGADMNGLNAGRFAGPPANADAALVDIADLDKHDCFDDPSLFGRTGQLREVACESPHDAQVVGVLPIPHDGEFPGVGAFRRQAAACGRSFESFVGVPHGESDLELSHYYPTRSGWADELARVITCVTFEHDGKLKDTVYLEER